MSEVRVFAGKLFRNHPKYEALSQGLQDYLSGRVCPREFGRDVPYHFPQEAEEAGLKHLHLVAPEYASRRDQHQRTSDRHLVYCEHATLPNTYAILLVIESDAHEKASDPGFMDTLIKMAEQFHSQTSFPQQGE